MSKQGMEHYETVNTKSQNEQTDAPEIKVETKHGKIPPDPIISGSSPFLKANDGISARHERQISDYYKEIDTDIARDNLENDIPEADLNDI